VCDLNSHITLTGTLTTGRQTFCTSLQGVQNQQIALANFLKPQYRMLHFYQSRHGTVRKNSVSVIQRH